MAEKFKKGSPEFVGEIRQSQVVTTWGPGSVADLRLPHGAPISVIMSGLDEWGQYGLQHPQAIHEPRLEQDLRVHGFRMPPVGRQREQNDVRSYYDVLPCVRFPKWMQCQNVQCGRLRKAGTSRGKRFFFETDKNGVQLQNYYCQDCSTGKERIWAVPVRLVIACPHGHIDEFPWKKWCRCTCSYEDMDLRIEQRFAGLSGRFIHCKNCNNSRSLEGVFSKKELEYMGIQCRANEPWLRSRGEDAEPAECENPESIRVLQRGASNLYWACIESSISIPQYASQNVDPLAELGTFANPVREQLIAMNEGDPAASSKLERLLTTIPDISDHLTKERIEEIIQQYQRANGNTTRDLYGRKWEEYQSFMDAIQEPIHKPEFVVEVSQAGKRIHPDFMKHLSSILLVKKLREVKAQTGFTRIYPPSGDFSSNSGLFGALRRENVAPPNSWLPAVEIRGEGIFIGFNLEKIEEWENQTIVQNRFAEHLEKLEALDTHQAPVNHSVRLLMLHSFSHALMRMLSLECGYSSSALMERIYSGPISENPTSNMAGVLIYTGSPDAGGTLGGLVQRGYQEFIIPTLRRVILESTWCSSDPLCITNTASITVPTNLAACHGCLLTSETSCEFPLFNGYLDRALLIGSPEEPELGFFHEVLENLRHQ